MNTDSFKNEAEVAEPILKKIDAITGDSRPEKYVAFAVGSLILSASLAVLARKSPLARLVGLWGPGLLLMRYLKSSKSPVAATDGQPNTLH